MLPYLLAGFRFPLGPDAPVYLWWLRLAGLDGLSVVGHRPAAPALALATRGTLGLTEVEVVAALEGALGVAAGLAAACLVRAGTRGTEPSRRGRSATGAGMAAWALAGALAGTFAVHLAAGYLANLAFAAAFLAAASLLAEGTGRGAVVAAAVLGVGGLAHPPFFLVGVAVLAATAALAWRADRGEAIRVVGATLGAGVVVGLGLLAVRAGPDPLEVDTSKDAFLRRAGLTAELRDAYLDRFVRRWARYVPWVSVPLAILGLGSARGFLGRFLRAWGLVTIVGVATCLATGIAPADRFVTFGFVVPVLAALGLVRLADALGGRRGVAIAVGAALSVAMLAGAWIAWDRQEPFLSELEVRRANEAARWVAATEPRTALVFPVNERDPQVTFLATRAANVLRATVPPERIRDVLVVVPAPTGAADEIRRALTRVAVEDAARAVAERGGRRLDVLLAPFDRPDLARVDDPGSPWRRVATGVFLASEEPERPGRATPLEPSSPGVVALAATASLALLAVAGYGWARAGRLDPVGALLLSPAAGAAAVALAAIALERLGTPLDGGPWGAAASALGAGSGYVAWLVLERRR